ncbi:MAG: LysR family transcriptional regulator, partial [Pseudomonadales bacterium]|nr:LysR family transcriptional regulator [Pseudomonadales bacterium]
MNWDNIRFFLAVARAGSGAAAARDMSVKHTTVLRRIDQLESDM